MQVNNTELVAQNCLLCKAIGLVHWGAFFTPQWGTFAIDSKNMNQTKYDVNKDGVFEKAELSNWMRLAFLYWFACWACRPQNIYSPSSDDAS